MTLRVPAERPRPGDRELDRDAARYVTRIHRLGPGDALVLFDPDEAIEADAHIVEAKKRVVIHVGEPRPATLVPRRRVTLLQGTAKGDKIDAVVRDATELGATRIVPVVCERSVARPPADRSARWRRIAVEAARQCGRGDAPVIAPVASLAEALERWVDGPGVALHPSSESPFADRLAALARAPEVVVLVGPEGGLTRAELAAAARAGLPEATLGPLTLRTETVCAAVLGALLVAR